jgi:hypothetical protein
VKIALSGLGIEECVDVPRAVTRTATDDLSAVEMLMYWTRPSRPLMIHPPSLRRELAVDLRPVVLGEPRSVVAEAAFFVGLGEEDHVAGERNLLFRQRHDGLRKDRHSALEIDGASPEHIPILHDAAERVERPFLALDPYDIRVRGEQDGALRSIAPQTGDEVGFAGLGGRDDIYFEPERPEAGRKQFGDRSFASGRVACVYADQFRQQHRCLVRRRIRLRRLIALPARRRQDNACNAREGEPDDDRCILETHLFHYPFRVRPKVMTQRDAADAM